MPAPIPDKKVSAIVGFFVIFECLCKKERPTICLQAAPLIRGFLYDNKLLSIFKELPIEMVPNLDKAV